MPSEDPSETRKLAAEQAGTPAVLPGAGPAGDEAAGGAPAEPAAGVLAEDAPAEAVTVTVTVGAAELAEALVLAVPVAPDEQPASTAAATPVMARLAAIPA